MIKSIERLDWDSNFFGFEVYKCEVQRYVTFEDIKEISATATLLYLFSNALILNKKLSRKLVDKKIIYKKVLRETPIEMKPSIYKGKINSIEELISLALLSGNHSRFKLDENMPLGSFETMYRQWIVNDLSDPNTFIIVEKSAESIVGFVTISFNSTNIAEIGLIAVSRSHQGKGIGSKLIKSAESLALKNGMSSIRVATQKKNIQANLFYQSNEYEMIDNKYIYHIWNK